MAGMLLVALLATGNAYAQSQPFETPESEQVIKSDPTISSHEDTQSQHNGPQAKPEFPTNIQADTISNQAGGETNAPNAAEREYDRHIQGGIRKYTRLMFVASIIQSVIFGVTLIFVGISAVAGILNAKAVINAERPHLLIEDMEVHEPTDSAYRWDAGGGAYKAHIEAVDNENYWEYT